VHVKGAGEQLDDLISAVAGVGPGTSLADKARAARTANSAGRKAEACQKLAAFTSEAQAQAGKKLTAAQAAELIASANRISAVLAC
jgi:hypothetical protein